MKHALTAYHIVSEALELLQTAQFGLEDMRLRPGRSKTGLRNAIVFGRTVTFALQNLRAVTPDFENWYAVKQEELKADPLMRFFHDLRTSIEKKALTPVRMRAHVHSSSTNDLNQFHPAPPNAVSFFIGDSNGGSGWIVRTERGEERYYIELPKEIGEVSLHLPDVPELNGYGDRRADELVEIYLNNLAKLVEEARTKFL